MELRLLVAALFNTALGWVWYGPFFFHRFWLMSRDSAWSDIAARGFGPWLSLLALWLLSAGGFALLVRSLGLSSAWQKLLLALGVGLMAALPLAGWALILDAQKLAGWWVEALYWTLGFLVMALAAGAKTRR